MTRRPTSHQFVVLAAIALSVVGCGEKQEVTPPVAETPNTTPFSIVSMDLGKALDADKKVVAPTDLFGVRDTIYLAISSEGSAAAVTLRARWQFEDGQTVADDAQQMAPNGPAQTEFHVMKATPWPVGKYTVEVFRDTTSAGQKEFMVK